MPIPDIILKTPPDKMGGWLPEEIEKMLNFVTSIQYKDSKLSKAQFDAAVAQAWTGVTAWLEDNSWKAHGVHHVGPECFSKITAVILGILKVTSVPPEIDRILRRLKIQQANRGWAYQGKPAAYRREDTFSEAEGELEDMSKPEPTEPRPAPKPLPTAARVSIPDVDSDTVIDKLTSGATSASEKLVNLLGTKPSN
jgi:hypothetical protein